MSYGHSLSTLYSLDADGAVKYIKKKKGTGTEKEKKP
jgi:hypothetical protein